jgi:hypothetical protein
MLADNYKPLTWRRKDAGAPVRSISKFHSNYTIAKQPSPLLLEDFYLLLISMFFNLFGFLSPR